MSRARGRAVTAGWRALRALPSPLGRAAFDAGARVAYRRDGRGVARLRSNLRRVLGEPSPAELERVVRAAVRSYARYWWEVFRLPAIPTRVIVERMTVRDDDILWDACRAGRGVILALPHTGNWDHAGAWLVARGHPFTTVAERLEPAELFDAFVAFRESLGMEVLPLTGGQRPPYAVLAERLRAGGVLCLLADRDLTATGVEVSFFGAPARMPAGPAALALDTGATLLPVTLSYPDARSWAGWIHPPVGVPPAGERAERIQAMTQRVADAFARGIAAAPADWHMFQRLWVADLDPDRLRRTTGAPL